jgi:hypothetical protein
VGSERLVRHATVLVRAPKSQKGGGVIEAAVTKWAIVVLGVLAIDFVATVVCWTGYARCVLRPAPRVEA